MHEDFVQDLNEYFDDHYVQPVAVEIKEDTIRQTSSSQVFNALSKIKKTATASDGFLFRAWKEKTAILTPAIETIWNLSLSTNLA